MLLQKEQGGGWCNNVTTCLARKNTCLGSSKQMANQLVFSGLLSNLQKFNPDFYNWNRIKVMYCDGSSFTGAVEAVNPATNLHFRIFAAVIEDLLAKRMKNAANVCVVHIYVAYSLSPSSSSLSLFLITPKTQFEQAIISGGSAGGLTFILHCDNFRALLSIGTKVKFLLDAAYFINTKDVSGTQHIEAFCNDVVTTHVTLREWWSRRRWGWWSSAMAEAPAMVEERREEKRRARARARAREGGQLASGLLDYSETGFRTVGLRLCSVW
ncbi:hypothetical protein HYC85_000231 [Camellia sinensis]|uniref:Pectin acetylesterase n=1 Tax=Camellia sinensis TaxID=4442 RepID=A0A7J7I1T8_CAMSI|nr:hypothetical protein HYC85_000231 [Camellia sinensis]